MAIETPPAPPGSARQNAGAAIDVGLAQSFVPLPLRLRRSTMSDTNMAVAWFDVVDSTRIAQQCLEAGSGGVETLTTLLNTHFDALIRTILAHGGEPLAFAGDALLAGWSGSAASARQSSSHAATCALAVLAARGALTPWGEAIRLHVAVGLGPARCVEIGTVTDALFVVAGDAVADLHTVLRTRAPGQCLISDVVRDALDVTAERAGLNASILARLPAPPPILPLTVPQLPKAAFKSLLGHVPLALGDDLDRFSLEWAVEIRRVTAVFVGLDLDHANAGFFTELEQVVQACLPIVRRHEGFLRVDSRGANLVALFGAPPITHADDPARAIHCALDLHHALCAGGRSVSLGVATGRVLCGLVGNDLLRSFEVFGDVINRAARLQGLLHGPVQCDGATQLAARGTIEFVSVGRSVLRGIASTAEVWVPRQGGRIEGHAAMHGRAAELERLLDAVRAARDGASGLVIVEAESGMGKSRLLSELQRLTASAGVLVLAGHANPIERRVPFRVWHEIIEGLFELPLTGHPAERRAAIIEQLGPTLARQAPLLNAVLPFDFPETAETRALGPAQRVTGLTHLVTSLLAWAARRQPLLVTLDDVHWAGEESWTLAQAACRDVRGLCLVMAMQPAGAGGLARALDDGAAMSRMRLDALTGDDLERLALARLGAREITPELSALLQARAAGHPFFCMELAQALRDEGVVEVTAGVARLTRDVAGLEWRLPDSLQATVVRRIDRLDPGSRITLKVASVAGLSFPSRLVVDVHPAKASSHADLYGHLRRHHDLGFLKPEPAAEAEAYRFFHGSIRDVAYALMPYGQRRPLHRDIATWHEGGERLNFAILAHHWEAAGEPARAAIYLQREAEQVFSRGLVRQSIEIGLQAATLLEMPFPSDPAALQPAVLAEIERIAAMMGERGPQDLGGLNVLADRRIDQVIRLLLTLAPFAYQDDLSLFALFSCTCLRLTLEHGNGPLAPDVYSMYSITYSALTGDRDMAASWSELGLQLARGGQMARCAFIHIWFHQHWTGTFDYGIDMAIEGAEAGLAADEVVYGCFNLSGAVVLLAASGRRLGSVIAMVRAHIPRNGRRVINAHHHLIQELQCAKALAGLTDDLVSLSDNEFDEARDLASVCETQLSNQIGYYFVIKAKLHVHAGDWSVALAWTDRAQSLLPFFSGQTAEFELTQYRGLAALAEAALVRTSDKQRLIDDGRACIARLRHWAARNPAMFTHRADLLEAMLCAASGDVARAGVLFRAASAGACAQGCLDVAGLANELWARCLRAQGEDAAAAAQAARAIYQEWGAAAKVALIAAEFGEAPDVALLDVALLDVYQRLPRRNNSA